MKIKRFQVSIYLTILSCFLYSFLLTETQHVEKDNFSSIEIPVKGPEESSKAREEWQMLRLRNPQTGSIPQNIRNGEISFAKTLPKTVTYASKFSAAKTLNWKSRGPLNIGGRTRAVAVDVTDDNIILAGGVTSGMWRSTDGGRTWTKTTAPNQVHSVTTVVQDIRPGKTHIWYYGTGEFNGSGDTTGEARGRGGTVGNGIYKSIDGGQSWKHLSATAPMPPRSGLAIFRFVSRLAINPSNLFDNELYAALNEGPMMKSTDEGESWTPVFSNQNRPKYSEIVITPTGKTRYAAVDGTSSDAGFLKSTDGVNWTNITPPGYNKLTSVRIAIAVAPSDENIVYFITGCVQLWKYTFVPGGEAIWENLSENLPNGNHQIRHSHNLRMNCQGGYNLLIAVHPNDENMVFIGGVKLYRSTDGFATGNNISYVGGSITVPPNELGSNHNDQHILAFSPGNANTMYAGHDGGISKTTNNTSGVIIWESLSKGYKTSQFYTIAIDYSSPGDNALLGGLQDHGTAFGNSLGGNDSWIKINGGDGGFAAIAQGKSWVYTSFQHGWVFRQKIVSVGTAWSAYPTKKEGRKLFITPFQLNPNNNKMMFYLSQKYVWRAKDVTISPPDIQWDKLTNTHSSAEFISSLEVSSTPANLLYYGNSRGKVFKLENAHSGNPSPVDITGIEFPVRGYANSITVDRKNADNVMVAFSNYGVKSIFFSSNGGSTWDNISGNLEEFPDGTGNGPSVRWAEIVNYEGELHYFVGTSIGLYSTSSLSGASTQWVQESPDLIGNATVEMIDSRDSDGFIAIGTHGDGAYSASLSDRITNVDYDQLSTIPQNFELRQNYPNPFNPETTIEYYLRQSADVRISIYNITGKEIIAFNVGTKPNGVHQIKWNGKNRFGSSVASGTYITRLQVNTKDGQLIVLTKKMTLIK